MYDWEQDLYLAHYGVKGMKWGVIRARKKLADHSISRRQAQNERLEQKIVKRQAKADKYALKALKRGDANKYALKAAKLNKQASIAEKKAAKVDASDSKYLKLNRKAAKKRYKASKLDRKAAIANMQSVKNIRLNTLSVKQKAKADKARYLVANNNYRIDKLSAKSAALGRALVEEGTAS